MLSVETLYVPDQGDVAIISATNGVGCVDPRTRAEVPNIGSHFNRYSNLFAGATDEGEVRTPGATGGDIMALLTIRPDLEVDDAVTLAVAWEMSPDEGRVAAFHGDTHGGMVDGCGHMAKAASGKYSAHYGLSGARAQRIMSGLLLLNNLRGEAWGIDMARPTLLGPHRESGVFVVESEDETVAPHTPDGKQFFRYDHLQHDGRLARLARYATTKAAAGLIRSVPVNTIFDAEELRDAATQQRNATLGIIAVGLPIYGINLTDGKREVCQIGEVEPVSTHPEKF